MPAKPIITFAVTGLIHTPSRSPHLRVIAEAAPGAATGADRVAF